MSKISEVKPAEHESFGAECLDFGQSLLHSALENPINGLVQVVDHATNAHLPELNIIGAPKHNSVGAKLGAIAGTAIDIAAVSIATGGVADVLGGAGVAAGIATAAATGAVFEGVLQPSDSHSKHFFQDRLTNGLIGATTFAAMSGTASLLGKTGLFAVPEVRSLAGSIAFGGIAGGAGGVAGAEATAILKEGKVLPSAHELVSNVGSSALFGAAYGALGYAYNQVNGPASRPTELKNDVSKVTTVNDANGDPVGFKMVAPGRIDNSKDVIWNATKMTDGTWQGTGKAVYRADGSSGGDADVPVVTNVVRDAGGGLTIRSTDGDVRTFSPDGSYKRTNPYESQFSGQTQEQAEKAKTRSIETYNGDRAEEGPSGYHRYDAKGNLIEFGQSQFSPVGAKMTVGADGTLETFTFNPEINQPFIQMTRTGAHSWDVATADNVYSWQGDVEPMKGTGADDVTGFKFTPKDGQPTEFNLKGGRPHVYKTLMATGQFKSYSPEIGYARIDDQGNLVVNNGSFNRSVVNGHNVYGETTVKPGDVLDLQVDIGDAFPEWEDHIVKLGKSASGKPTLNGHVIQTGMPTRLAPLIKATAN